MSKKYERDEELEVTRTSPYEDIDPQEEEAAQAADQPYADDDQAYNQYEEYEEYEDYGEYEEEEDEEPAGFLASAKGKILLGVIAALLIVLLALVAFMLFGGSGGDGAQQLPGNAQQTEAPVQTQAPTSIVFAPQATEAPAATEAPVIVMADTPEPTAMPTARPTATPEPEPTATPLPIILSNTPTPSPTPTATPTPSPSPSPTPSPKPTPTPVVDLANGVVNRDAKLRESASSSGKIKQTIKKGETVTIHEALLDKDGKVWYALTVDDAVVDGYMRDYVVDVEGDIAAPTATPKATAAPKATAEPSNEMTVSKDITPEPTATPEPDQLGTGKANRDANVRKVMNGKVITTLRKGKPVSIVGVRLDKNGDVWYEVRVSGSQTEGFMRDYVIDLDDGVELETPTAAAPATEAEPEADAGQEAADTAEAAQEAAKSAQDGPEAIGKAKTNRDANVREKPVSGAKVVRQLTSGNALNIFGKYEDEKGQLWYEVATESGKTKGFVRDYVVNVLNIDKSAETKSYEEQSEAAAEETEEKAEAENAIARNSRFKYAGNKESKVFHELYCDLLPASSKNLVYMESRTYAVNTGYTACEVCTP